MAHKMTHILFICFIHTLIFDPQVFSERKMNQTLTEEEQNFDRETALKAFDETKAGVKGLVDQGITKVPKIFIQPQTNDLHTKPICSKPKPTKFPLIDLQNVYESSVKHKEVVNQVRVASETLGFFQVINHGIPKQVLDEMLHGVREFYEQDAEERKKWYTRDFNQKVIYNSNFDLYSSQSDAADWRDTVFCQMAPHFPDSQELPSVCSDIMIEYTKQVLRLGTTLFQLLSDALGLEPDHLQDMGCSEGLTLLCHYYPSCPEPDLTFGATQHADSGFLTVLLNDTVSGLQVLYKNQWFDVPPLPGVLVVNIGDLLQLVSNDRFKSAEHRVLANSTSSRVSVACFFRNEMTSTRLYRPIDDPPKYRATTVGEYVTHYNTKGLDGTSALSHFRI